MWVVFSGLNVGEYGHHGKRMLLDTNARVPLIFYDPTAASWQGESTMGGGTSDAMVELIE